jgi:hypothetical protein
VGSLSANSIIKCFWRRVVTTSYSHVENQVRNYLRRPEDFPGQPNVLTAEKSPVTDEMLSRIALRWIMDALVEIAQNPTILFL